MPTVRCPSCLARIRVPDGGIVNPRARCPRCRAALLDGPPSAFTSGASFYSVSQPAFFALLALAFALMACLWVAMSRGN